MQAVNEAMNELSEKEKLPVTCRPAQEGDTPAVLALTSTIWDGHDYVPQVWAEWLADTSGRLAVAEWDGQVVGLAKLTRLEAGEWWLEGLRVDPQHQGHGVAGSLHGYMLGEWQRHGGGVLRLATASTRVPVHRLCEKSGFRKVAEFGWFRGEAVRAEAEVEAPGEQDPAFRPLVPEEAPAAVQFAWQSTSLALANGLIDLGWQWAELREGFLTQAAAEGRLWWWHSGEGASPTGLLMAREDEDEEVGALFCIQLLACRGEDLAAILVDFRRLAGRQGYAWAGWVAPEQPEALAALAAAGYQRAWEDKIFVFEKRAG